jgi:hypothetical protein
MVTGLVYVAACACISGSTVKRNPMPCSNFEMLLNFRQSRFDNDLSVAIMPF